MAFNFSKKYDFLPKMSIGGNQLEVVQSTKLLGVILSSDLRWNLHTEYITKKAKQRLWYLRRLSTLGASRDTLLNNYKLMIRSVLELCSPVYAGALTQTNIEDFEEVQKSAFKIILRGNYHSYENALEVLGEVTLESRRNISTFKFAKGCLHHPKMSHLFQRRATKTRNGLPFMEPLYKKARGYNGPIPFMTRLLNNKLK